MVEQCFSGGEIRWKVHFDHNISTIACLSMIHQNDVSITSTVLQIAMYNKRYYNMNDYFTLISLADALWIVFNKVLLSLPVSGT